jgi:GTP cyclohydrolase II
VRVIEEERQEAQDYAIRAAILEDLGLKVGARLFRKAIKLCDQKIAILQQIEVHREAFRDVRALIQASSLFKLKSPHNP